MTKAELIDAVQAKFDGKMSKKDAAQVVEAIFETVQEAVKTDGRFAYPGFGTFSVKERAERQGRNPKTKEAITIPASRSVGFKPAPAFKDILN